MMRIQRVQQSELLPWQETLARRLQGEGTLFITTSLRGLGMPGLRERWREIPRDQLEAYAKQGHDLLWRAAGTRSTDRSRWFIRAQGAQGEPTPGERLRRWHKKLALRMARLEEQLRQMRKELLALQEAIETFASSEAKKISR